MFHNKSLSHSNQTFHAQSHTEFDAHQTCRHVYMWYHLGKHCECSLGVHVVDELSHNVQTDTITLNEMTPPTTYQGVSTLQEYSNTCDQHEFKRDSKLLHPKVRVICQLIHDLFGQVHKPHSLQNTYGQHDAWFIDNMLMVYF